MSCTFPWLKKGGNPDSQTRSILGIFVSAQVTIVHDTIFMPMKLDGGV